MLIGLAPLFNIPSPKSGVFVGSGVGGIGCAGGWGVGMGGQELGRHKQFIQNFSMKYTLGAFVILKGSRSWTSCIVA